MLSPKELAIKIMTVLDEKKASDMLMLDVNHLTTIADYFIICSGRSNLQVRALSDAVDELIAVDGIMPTRIDGREDARWIVMDYSCVIVHIFCEEEREYYHLERLWTDGTNTIAYPLVEG